ncbi:MAG: hypothetical protein ABSG37_00550 [Candidatus Limnocylindrales bacterium]|jgi:hypothetical protein
MRQGGGFRVLAALLVLGFITVLAAGAYGAGFVAGSGSGTTGVSPWAYGGAFAAGHLIGLLVTVLVLILIVRLIGLAVFGGHHRAWARRGYWRSGDDAGSAGPGNRPGGWHGSEWRDARQAAFDEFHRRAHTAGPPATGSDATAPTAR